MGFSKLIFLGVNSILFLVVSVLATKVQGLNTFNVRKFGAKGYGKTEDTQGIMKAWKKACASTSPSTVVIPKGKYNVGPLMFLGPCKASTISINLRGILQAPRDLNKHKSQDGWIVFQYINGLTVFGGGTFDGQGSVAWAVNDCAKTGKCSSLPISLRLNGITNSTFKDITSLDSKLFHLNLIGCKNLTLKKITISAPDHSLNTDGIHIGRSLGINIFDSVIKTGDDCISLGDGSQKINIERVKCGPGHGISIGSLGKYNNEEPVKGVTVRNCTLSDTMNGVRIKTWPASPYGVASDLHFEDIVMNNVGTPILIDQKYCPYNKCQANIPSRVKLSNVSFKKIRGTSSTQTAVKLVCSRELPCQNVEIGDINLRYRGKDGSFATSECTNVKPRITGKLYPRACARMISS